MLGARPSWRTFGKWRTKSIAAMRTLPVARRNSMWSIWWLRCIGEDMISGYENSASAAASASLPARANVNNASEAIDWGSSAHS